ncbi:MAG TPA: MoxR family ATPase [Pyrinomonadaceae bacterium]|nr:MoxR family ATPase [Pyrinomonadaceae bacterium]
MIDSDDARAGAAPDEFKVYSGKGETISQRNVQFPTYREMRQFSDPRNYDAEQGLRDAVNVALALGQPLLVTGEPGTGKTQLASSVAYELGLEEKTFPLEFHTKSTSTAQDLFYRYEALAHFSASRFGQVELPADPYIRYEALGLAILLSLPADDPQRVKVNPYLPQALRGLGNTRSVVLIDEIDKAPRDLPNDVLNEIERMAFEVKETGARFTAMQKFRPILILTSNSERDLPDAFLRRCVFYHIEFPDKDEQRLREIVGKRLTLDSARFNEQMLAHALQHFVEIRKLQLQKRPATAELLGWLRVLEHNRIDAADPKQKSALAQSYSVLVKNKDDLTRLQKRFIDGDQQRQ